MLQSFTVKWLAEATQAPPASHTATVRPQLSTQYEPPCVEEEPLERMSRDESPSPQHTGSRKAQFEAALERSGVLERRNVKDREPHIVTLDNGGVGAISANELVQHYRTAAAIFIPKDKEEVECDRFDEQVAMRYRFPTRRLLSCEGKWSVSMSLCCR